MFARLIRLLAVILFALSLIALSSGCASVGIAPRERAASVVNIVVGSPFYAATYVSGLFLNVIAYGTAWIAGEQEQTPLWFSADYGPTYASINSPWCWMYAGAEPEDRVLKSTMMRGSHIRQIPLSSMHTEWPPAFAFCRTNVGTRYNKRGDESFPVK